MNAPSFLLLIWSHVYPHLSLRLRSRMLCTWMSFMTYWSYLNYTCLIKCWTSLRLSNSFVEGYALVCVPYDEYSTSVILNSCETHWGTWSLHSVAKCNVSLPLEEEHIWSFTSIQHIMVLELLQLWMMTLRHSPLQQNAYMLQISQTRVMILYCQSQYTLEAKYFSCFDNLLLKQLETSYFSTYIL